MLLPVSVYAAAEAGMFDADARLTVTGLSLIHICFMTLMEMLKR